MLKFTPCMYGIRIPCCTCTFAWAILTREALKVTPDRQRVPTTKFFVVLVRHALGREHAGTPDEFRIPGNHVHRRSLFPHKKNKRNFHFDLWNLDGHGQEG
uniref:Uncharacterized protein n=1 Tax=Coccidioides posadasii RMSCC 3488 TaxID=454284 RepID=A0A0J6I5H6_COCPO|nr:hypothetical protein CPAG_02960 [Coccidioides posadasii RMSCC 3488]